MNPATAITTARSTPVLLSSVATSITATWICDQGTAAARAPSSTRMASRSTVPRRARILVRHMAADHQHLSVHSRWRTLRGCGSVLANEVCVGFLVGGVDCVGVVYDRNTRRLLGLPANRWTGGRPTELVGGRTGLVLIGTIGFVYRTYPHGDTSPLAAVGHPGCPQRRFEDIP
jgi:hypothetical protein